MPLSFLAAQCSAFPYLTCPAGSLYSIRGLLNSTHPPRLQKIVNAIISYVISTDHGHMIEPNQFIKQKVEHPSGINLY